MPRHRLPEGERRENVNVRLQKKTIQELDKLGKRSSIIEKAVLEYLERSRRKS